MGEHQRDKTMVSSCLRVTYAMTEAEKSSCPPFPSGFFRCLWPNVCQHGGAPYSNAKPMLQVSTLLQWPKGLEFPSMKSVTYLKTCLVWVLVFISPAQLDLMLHLLWLTSATAFKSPPLKEDYGMCCTHHGILTHQSVRNQYSPCQYFSTHP